MGSGAGKNMATNGSGVRAARGMAPASAAKPSIPVRNGGGYGNGNSMSMGKACSSLKKQGMGREGPRSGGRDRD